MTQPTDARAILDQLFAESATRVYAVLDGAAVGDLLRKLHVHKPEHCCLFSGDLAPDLMMAAPYLVRLERDGAFTDWLVEEGWGGHWGIFAAADSSADFRQIRKHFRKFLMVRSPQGKPLYFRYCDPRVFRVYLPTCNDVEMDQVYGPVRFYAMEADGGKMLLRVWKGKHRPRVEELRLAGAPA